MSDGVRAQRRFQLILIKPSHYDDDGYVIQWFRSIMPSNSLAAIYGLAMDAADRRVLGLDVSIDVTPIDETNTRIKPEGIITQIAGNGGFWPGGTSRSAIETSFRAPSILLGRCAPPTSR